MKTALIQFLLIVVLGTGFAVLAGRSLAGLAHHAPRPGTATEAVTESPAPVRTPPETDPPSAA